LSGEIDAARSTIEAAASIIADSADSGKSVSIEDAIHFAKRGELLEGVRARQAANDNTPSPAAYRTSFTGENEWYTPERYIEMARKVLGTIDVDPASNDYAQATVRAATFYTVETNGLDKEWRGKVWMNPPYSQPEIVYFIDKIIEECQSGRCTEAIILTHNSTDTKWFNRLFENADAICWTTGRVRFVSPKGEFASPAMGQTFTYFGLNPEMFAEVFSEIGNVWGPKWRKIAA
jgi:phage N-6-adenine-methyltransferase